MKIHFFVRTLNDEKGGGSHYNSIAFIRGLREQGHSVTVHVFSGQGGNHFPPDIEPILHDGWGLSFLKSRNYIAQLLKEYEADADAYFLYAVEFAWGGGLYRRRGGKTPVVVYMDAYLPSMNEVHYPTFKEKIYHYKRLPWDKTVGLLDARYIDRFLPVSSYIGNVYKKFGFPKDRFTVLPSIVPPPPPEVLASTSQKNNDAVDILYVGRLIYDKGVDVLIDALGELREFSWRLTLVGDGDMRKSIEAQVAQSNLPIDIKGWVTREEVWEAYKKADLFVHPARWADPGPRSITDAMWCGVPAIVPDTGGSSGIAGKAGIVFKTGDKNSLKDALKSFLENPALREQLISHTRAEAERYEEHTVYPQLENILKEVTGRSATS